MRPREHGSGGRNTRADTRIPEAQKTRKRTKVYLEVFDPFHLMLSHVKGTLGLSAESSAVVAATTGGEGHTARFEFRGDPWPSNALGDTEAAVEFRDHWKDPSLFYATEWLMSKSPSTFEPLAEDNGEVYLVVAGYQGTIPNDLLREVLRHGLQLEVMPETGDREGRNSAPAIPRTG